MLFGSVNRDGRAWGLVRIRRSLVVPGRPIAQGGWERKIGPSWVEHDRPEPPPTTTPPGGVWDAAHNNQYGKKVTG